ncbi:MAG: diguanylate cyclase [Pseudomonadota bacterium]
MQIERKLKIALAVAMVVMFITALVPFQTAAWVHTLQDSMRDAQRRIELIEEHNSLMKDAERGQRGFVITGSEDFLAPYNEALPRISVNRNFLREAMQRTPAEIATIKQLDVLTDEKLDELDLTVQLRRLVGFGGVEPVVSSGRGKDYMDRMRAISDTLVNQEIFRRAELGDKLEWYSKVFARVGFAATLVNMLLLALTMFFVFRLLKQQKTTAATLSKTSSDLSAGLQELADRNTEITLIGKMVQALQSPVSIDEAYELIGNHCNQLFPDTAGVLYIFRNSADLLEKKMQWGIPDAERDAIEPHDCWGLRRGQPHRVNRPEDLLCPHYKNSEAAERISHLCLPLMSQGEVLGLIYIETCHVKDDITAGRFTAKMDLLAISVSEQVALALSNIRLRELLKLQSIVDPLTGLFNRRYMEETLTREIARTVRKSLTLSVVVMDIDHFKNVNDTFGHDAGDAVLRSLAHLIKTIVRDTDIVCRFGGEELLIILPECTKQDASACAEKLRNEIRTLDVRLGSMQIGRVTVSQGIATCPEDGKYMETLVKAADAAMYHAKRTGRDRVIASEATLA